MRFETSKSTPPHLNRRLQLRMLSFIAMFAVVLYLWNSLQSPSAPDSERTGSSQPGATGEIDFNVRDSQPWSLKDDEFIAPPDLNRKGDPPAEGEPAWQEPSLGGSETERQEAFDREVARRQIAFDKSLLGNIKDNTLGVRRDEAEAYYRVLAHARRVSPTELERAGAKDVLYINLMTEPDRYRGDPITIHGDLWRLYEFQAGPNDRDLKTLYEGWVFTGDSGNHPYRVVFTSLPRELEPGENLRKSVRVTGYFFKREGYPSNGGMHVAPTLLAQRMTIYRAPNAPPPTDDIVPYMIGLVTAIGLVFLVTLTSFAISDRRAAHAARLRDLNAPRPSFEGIQVANTITVGESLRLMAEQAWESTPSDQSTGTHDPASLLRARDTTRERDPLRAALPAPTDNELAERQRVGGTALHNWVSRQPASAPESAPDPYDHDQRERERLETESVLNRLQSTSVSDPKNGRPPKAEIEAPADSRPDSSSNGSANSLIPDASDELRYSSKLAAWEQEIQQFATRKSSEMDDSTTDQQRAARYELERDQAARDRELRERLQHQRTEQEQKRREADEAERSAKTRREWELHRQQIEREQRDQDEAARQQREREERESTSRRSWDYDRRRTERDREPIEQDEPLSHERNQDQLTESTRRERDSERQRIDREQRDQQESARQQREREERESTSRRSWDYERRRSDRDRDQVEQDETARIEREREEEEARTRRERESERHRAGREQHDRDQTTREQRDHDQRSRDNLTGGGSDQADQSPEDEETIDSADENDVDDSLLSDADREQQQRHRKKRRGGWGWNRRRK